jgi:DNA-directed RNA polymerase specialized sigma24 family protein
MSKFDEIEHVLFDYPAMQVHLEKLAESADAYDFSYQKPRVSGGDETSRVEKIAVKRADYDRCVKVVDAILAVLPGEERKFVSLRYFQGLPMETVARELHVEERTVYNIRSRALGKFAVALGWGRRHPAFEQPVQVQGTLGIG